MGIRASTGKFILFRKYVAVRSSPDREQQRKYAFLYPLFEEPSAEGFREAFSSKLQSLP